MAEKYAKTVKLDERDRRLLAELERDGRASLTTLAKRVKLSKDAVAYRIRRMEEEKVLLGFYTLLNITKLGLSGFKVAVKLQNATPEKRSEIIEYLKKNVAGWMASCDGRWDLVFIAWKESAGEFERLLTDFLSKYGEFVGERDLNILTEGCWFNRKFLAKGGRVLEVRWGEERKGGGVDEKDQKILRALVDNARMRLVELADVVGMTPEGVKNRIGAMEREGVISGFKPVINTSALGYQFYNVMIRLNNPRAIKKMFAFLKEHPNVVYYSKYAGSFDICADIEIEGPEEFRKVMDEFRKNFAENIRTYEPLLVYEEHRRSYSPF
ncbi:MAG: AsnC family transcriptional regulator [Candidatus Micrarchaeota archaeon]